MLNTIVKGITGILVSIGIFFGVKKQPEPTPQVEMVTAINPSPEVSPVENATPSAIPKVIKISSSPTPQIKPSPSPENLADLNIEIASLIPEKFEGGPEEISKKMDAAFSGEKNILRRDNKIKKLFLRVRNNGHVDSDKFNINVIVDGESKYQFETDIIKKQEAKSIGKEIENMPDSLGEHKVEVQVNPAKDFPETRFDNNSKVTSYEIIN